jgi:hypothetical protein
MRYQIRKLLCYTLYCTTVVRVPLLQASALSHSTVCTGLVAGVGVALPLADDHGLEVLALGHLGLNLLNVLGEVGCVLRVSLVPEDSQLFDSFSGRNVRPRPWSTPPWARADGSWTTAMFLSLPIFFYLQCVAASTWKARRRRKTRS